MIDLQLRAFRANDLSAIKNRDGSELPVSVLAQQVIRHPAFTATLDGRPLGCAGITLMWPGVGHAWMVLSDELDAHGLWMFRMVRAVMRDVSRIYGLHRIETEALEESLRNQRWLEGLGFLREECGRATAVLPDKRSMIRYELIGV